MTYQHEVTASHIEDNVGNEILVMETSRPETYVDKEVQAPTSVALTCVQCDKSTIEFHQEGEKWEQESTTLEGAHDVNVEFDDCASDQPSRVHKDLQLDEVEKVDAKVLPMVH